MFKNIRKGSLWLTIGLYLILMLSYSNVFAWGRSGHREVVMFGHERYHYHNGRFYRPSWFGFEIALFTPPIGATVKVLPLGYKTIIFSGSTYYYYDDIYYTRCPSGYIVVPTPQISPNVTAITTLAPSHNLSAETFTVNVPNSNGSYAPVTLTKHNNGYLGPQGEYYPGNPTIEQLKVLYGK